MKPLHILHPKSKAGKGIFVALMAAVSVFVMFSMCRYGGLGDGDEGYQLMCVRNYTVSPLGMLSYWIGSIWLKLFPGYEILAARCLVSLLMFAAICVGCWFCWRRTGNLILAAALMPLCAIGNRMGDFSILNWDTGTYLWDAICLAALLSFTYRPSGKSAAIAGSMLALMTLGRLPLGIEVFTAIVVVWVSCHRAGLKAYDTWRYIGIGLIAFIIVALLTMTLMCGSPAAYFDAFVPENFITGHGASDIIAVLRRLQSLIPRQIWYLLLGIMALGAAGATYCAKRHKVLVIIAVLGIIAYDCAVMSVESQYGAAWSWVLLGCFLSVLLVVLGWLPVGNLIRRGETPPVAVPWLQLITILVFILLISFGSDTFFERMCSSFALPMAVGCIWPVMRTTQKEFLRLYLVFVLVIFGGMWCIKNASVALNYESRLDQYPSQKSLITTPYQYDFYKANHASIAACRDAGINYFIFGARHNLLYVFGDDNGYPFHWFDAHLFRLPGGFFSAIKPYAEKNDALIYSGEMGVDPEDLARKMAPLGYVRLWSSINSSLYVKSEKVPQVQKALERIIATDPYMRDSLILRSTQYDILE